MIGYSPQLVSAVWTGYDNGKPLNLQVIKPMQKIFGFNLWKKHSMERQLNHLKPQKVRVGVYINPENGKLATKDCPVRRFTYFAVGTEPTEYCTDHLLDEERRTFP